MKVNQGSALANYIDSQSAKPEFRATGRINTISNTTNACPWSNLAKRDDYRGIAAQIANSIEEKLKEEPRTLWDKVKRECKNGRNPNQTKIVDILLSPFTFNALEVVKPTKIEKFINLKCPGLVKNMAVNNSLYKLLGNELKNWGRESRDQYNGLKLIYIKYKAVSCYVTLLTLIRLDSEFEKLHFSEGQFRSALHQLEIMKSKATLIEINLSYMIANTHIPEEIEQWYEQKKVFFSEDRVRGSKFKSRLRDCGIPKNMTVEQFQKLFLRDGRCDMTCSMIYLEVYGLGVKLQPYNSPITILKDEGNSDAIMLSDESSSYSVLPLPPVITQRAKLPYDDSKIMQEEYYLTTKWASHTAALPVISDEPSILTFDAVSGSMHLTRMAEDSLRADSFSHQLCNELEG